MNNLHTGMTRLTHEELAAHTATFDAAVRATPQIDHFCSSSDWILPADAALMPPRAPYLWRGDHAWLAMARGDNRDGWTLLQSLEAAWGLACPIVGANPGLVAEEVTGLLRSRPQDWDVALFSGLPRSSSLFAALVRCFTPVFQLRGGSPTRRHVASLEGGLDGYLSRRSRNLRKALRRSERLAKEERIEFEVAHCTTAAQADQAYARVLDVESRSWKGRKGIGIDQGGMCEFYRLMGRRLAVRGTHRLIFATRDGRDIGYVLGGVLDKSYRGLQFSYDEKFRSMGLGGLLQLAQITELCDQGFEEYDLGTDLDYKRRWADGTMDTVLLIVSKL